MMNKLDDENEKNAQEGQQNTSFRTLAAEGIAGQGFSCMIFNIHPRRLFYILLNVLRAKETNHYASHNIT